MEGTDPHRRRSIRLAEFNYTAAGAYFVTVVTGGRECLLGEIVEDKIRLSPVGQIVMYEWERLAERFSGIMLDEFVVMPNHVHGIIVIVKEGAAFGLEGQRVERTFGKEGAAPGLEDQGVERKPLRPYGQSNFAVAAGSVGAMVRAFKSSAALRVNAPGLRAGGRCGSAIIMSTLSAAMWISTASVNTSATTPFVGPSTTKTRSVDP